MRPQTAWLVVPALLGCASVPPQPRRIEAVEQSSGTPVLLIALSAVDDRVVWASGAGGTFVRTVDGGDTWKAGTVKGAEHLQFRDVHAIDANNAYLLSIGPADSSRIYRTADGGATWHLQIRNADPKGFYDCMAFWDPSHGIVVGDAFDDRIYIMQTTDGAHWERIRAQAPRALPDEGFFAASGTCVITRPGGLAWAAAGTPGSRVMRTSDYGRTWSVDTVPVKQIASVSFRDDRNGIVFAWDSTAATATSRDGGATWTRGGRPPFPKGLYGGVYVPGTAATVVTVGPGGLGWSPDEGRTWNVINNENYWSVTFASRNAGWAVGTKGRITKLTGF
ncbi:MAG: hypothetical protein H0W68_03680 [Gemmatimonadaceae bacterium]|nr:hypothetical protein [Gemmatimonadaceae bacterium]